MTIAQGLWGILYHNVGDFSPPVAPSGTVAKCKGQSIPKSGVIYLFPLSFHRDATRSKAATTFGPYLEIASKAVATTSSDVGGFYEISAPKGSYSILVLENDGLVTDSLGNDGSLGPVSVGDGLTRRDLALMKGSD